MSETPAPAPSPAAPGGTPPPFPPAPTAVPGGTAVPFSAVPAPSGLYDPANDKDACGVAFVADARGRRSRAIVAAGLTALHNPDPPGAAGPEPNSGDGAGILTQIPDALLRAVVDFELPPVGEYAVGVAFLPAAEIERAARP